MKFHRTACPRPAAPSRSCCTAVRRRQHRGVQRRERQRSPQELSGTVKVDGSSTVFPLTTAAAELFREEQPKVNVTVGKSGTGGGFEKFCNGETDISDASRPIKDEERHGL